MQEARSSPLIKLKRENPFLHSLNSPHLFHSLRRCAFIQIFILLQYTLLGFLPISPEHGSLQSKSRCPSLHGHHHHRRHLQRRCCSRSRLSHQHWYFSFLISLFVWFSRKFHIFSTFSPIPNPKFSCSLTIILTPC